jgi:2-succinyl-6-hydroxy-2,4-cyclohexadiene-1-carboxylate synthase
VTPARTHSSTRVAQNVAAMSPRSTAGAYGRSRERAETRRGRAPPPPLGAAGPSGPAAQPPGAGTLSDPPLVLAHGFTQSALAWGPFLAALGDGRPLRPVDLAGHGGAPVTEDLPEAAHRLGREGGWGPYLGYSLGGRVALHLAVTQPELVTALVLIGAHPGIEDTDQRAERRRADDELADRLLAIGLDAFLDEWLAQPLFATLPAGSAQRDLRLRNDPAALAATLRNLSTGRQTPLWDLLPGLGMPVLVLAGENDHKYTRIGRQTVATIGTNAGFAPIPGAGHAAHLEQPAATARLVVDFLARAGA